MLVEVRRRRLQYGDGEDERFRGLYVSEELLDRVLDRPSEQPVPLDEDAAVRQRAIEASADLAEREGNEVRLRTLQRAFDLSQLDVQLLLVAAAPSIDRRFEQFYGYLHEDVTLRHASVGLALRLCGLEPSSGAARARLGPAGALVRGGLVEIGATDRPQLTRTVRVPDRVVGHLLGDDALPLELDGLAVPGLPLPGHTSRAIAGALRTGAPLVHVRDPAWSGGLSAAAAAAEDLGTGALVVDLSRVPSAEVADRVAASAVRDARMTGQVLVAGPVEALSEHRVAAVRVLVDGPGPVVVVGRNGWDPAWAPVVPVLVDVVPPDPEAQARLWTDLLGADVAARTGAVDATVPLRLSPQQAQRAAAAATRQAAAAAREVDGDDLRRGVRAQNASGLQRLARRIEPTATWDDLVVPPNAEEELRVLPLRWRHRDRVLGDWGMGGGAGRGRGVSALFAGGSGTGKTLSAEVIACDLGLDLYVVDLSTVVDKYIGETSKNLERIFDQADRVNGVLLFDEADALFGKRSAVSDAKDRHANVEVAFLLQRMESFDGVAILTTNLAANLDDAFLRRLDAIVDFPSPDEALRERLWDVMLGRGVPVGDDVDTADLGRRFTLSGSEIRNVVTAAAYLAAARDGEVCMEDLVRATVREHRKIGRHLTPADLGQHAYLVEPR